MMGDTRGEKAAATLDSLSKLDHRVNFNCLVRISCKKALRRIEREQVESCNTKLIGKLTYARWRTLTNALGRWTALCIAGCLYMLP